MEIMVTLEEIITVVLVTALAIMAVMMAPDTVDTMVQTTMATITVMGHTTSMVIG